MLWSVDEQFWICNYSRFTDSPTACLYSVEDAERHSILTLANRKTPSDFIDGVDARSMEEEGKFEVGCAKDCPLQTDTGDANMSRYIALFAAEILSRDTDPRRRNNPS